MNTHRIMTDGLRYKIQQRKNHRFLWWTWERWHDLGQLKAPHPSAWFVVYYDTLEEAKNRCAEMTARASKKHEWRNAT